MYTRYVRLQLKAGGAPEFTRTLENEVIPMLRKQKGFRDEITLVAAERNGEGSSVSRYATADPIYTECNGEFLIPCASKRGRIATIG